MFSLNKVDDLREREEKRTINSAPYSVTNALSFYMFQNVLCRFKFFEPAQKFDCIYFLSYAYFDKDVFKLPIQVLKTFLYFDI